MLLESKVQYLDVLSHASITPVISIHILHVFEFCGGRISERLLKL